MSQCPETNTTGNACAFGEPLLELQPAEPGMRRSSRMHANGLDVGGFQEPAGRFVLLDAISDRPSNRATDLRQDASSSTTCTTGEVVVMGAARR